MLIQERIKFLFPYLGAAVAGTLLVCAYTPESYSWLAIAGLLLWFGLLARSGSRRESVLLGLIFGLFWFDLGLQWTVNSMTEHGHMPWLLSELGVFLLALLLSISPVLTALCTGLRAHNSLLELSLRWVSAFTFFEWFRGVGVMKFDWLNPAYTTLDLPIAGWAPLVGEYGLLLAYLLAIASLLLLVCGALKEKIVALCLLVALIGTSYWSMSHPWSQKIDEVKVELIQPNMPVVDAFTRVRAADRIHKLMDIRASFFDIKDKPLFVLIPEGIVNEPIEHLSPAAGRGIQMLLQDTQVPTYLNAFRMSNGEFFNTAFLLDNQGLLATVDKRRLVPFGEYVPAGARWFVNLLGIPMADLTPGADTQRTNLIDGVNVGLLICYENLFGDVLRQYWATGTPPDIIAVTANLGWFGLEANAQHLQISRLRALEVARAIVSVSNNGLSAVVDTQGKILSTLPINTADVDVVSVPKMQGEATPYVRVGVWPVLMVVILLFGFALWRREGRNEN